MSEYYLEGGDFDDWELILESLCEAMVFQRIVLGLSTLGRYHPNDSLAGVSNLSLSLSLSQPEVQICTAHCVCYSILLRLLGLSISLPT